MSLRVLLAVDGSSHALRAVEHLLRLREAGCVIEAHLLNVQLPLETGHVRMFIARESLEAYYRDEGLEALREACALMERSGQVYSSHIAVGHAGETIARYAGELAVDLVIMGTHGRTGLRQAVMGSVATGVLRLAPVPVTVVRPAPG
ncbi:MAG: hypothetical protein CALGDGBN_00497 [Pseudomonadales bacterium]|nr:hypothetical protein [Pseudomonadales bacterium]